MSAIKCVPVGGTDVWRISMLGCLSEESKSKLTDLSKSYCENVIIYVRLQFPESFNC